MKQNNFRRLLLTLETLADLGPELTAERGFDETAGSMLGLMGQAVGAQEAVLFTYSDKPSLLKSAAWQGFTLFPETAVIPLLPRHVHALATTRAPQVLGTRSWDRYLSSNGNVAPELFRCINPLRVGNRLVGLLAFGRRQSDAAYGEEELEALHLLSSYASLAVHNHNLSESLQARVSENLKLLASLHSTYDHTLETFAAAIDCKDTHTRGHSLRVGRYAAGIAESMGMDKKEVAGLRSGGYLHDIGKVTVDKYIFRKPGALDARELREMADHTVIGHQIVSGVEFPWPNIPEVVRSHHERMDCSGYPDKLPAGELSLPARIVAVADTFDAMTSARSFRPPMSVGEALSEIVKLSPTKFDATVVQGLLVQARRDSAGSNPTPFLDAQLYCNIAPPDIDQLAAALNHRLTSNRVYSA